MKFKQNPDEKALQICLLPSPDRVLGSIDSIRAALLPSAISSHALFRPTSNRKAATVAARLAAEFRSDAFGLLCARSPSAMVYADVLLRYVLIRPGTNREHDYPKRL